MRILYLSQLIPYPLDAGPKVRSYYVLRHLAARGHEVTLLAFSRESDTFASIEHLRPYCCEIHTVSMARSRGRDVWHLARSVLMDQPFLIIRDSVAEFAQKAEDLVATGKFDAIHADQLWMAQYALSAATAAPEKRPRLVLDQHNAMFLIPERLAMSETSPAARRLWRRESNLMRRYEVETCRRFDCVVWVTAEDRQAVSGGELMAAQESVIPICVDPAENPIIRRSPKPHRVTFLGGLHWPPNAAGIVWFAREVWPRVRRECPEAMLTVIGKSPPAELIALQKSEPATAIDITGYVDDPNPYLAETAVFIVPLHAGGGMRVKILDAWTWGLPVVATTIGAEGIAYSAGQDLLLADERDAFAAAVVRIMADDSLARSLAEFGRCAIENQYDWASVYKRWDEIYS